MKVVIIGGVAGGATAAARIRRLDEKAEIVVFERSGYISYANCGLPYYVGDVITDKDELTLQSPAGFKRRFDIDVKIRHEVTAIDKANKTVKVKNLESGEEFEESYDKLVLAPGAKPFVPDIPGAYSEKIFSVRTVEDTFAIKKYIQKKQPKSAVVIGGGFVGVEMAENLSALGIKVTLAEAAKQLLSPFDGDMAAFIHAEVRRHGINLLLGKGVKGFAEKEGMLEVYIDGEKTLRTDMAIMAVGVTPETSLAEKAGLELGLRKSIAVNERMETSAKDIYAVGDAVQVKNFVTGEYFLAALAGPANKQARIAADNICGIKSEYKGAQGSSVVKVFDITAASTGINERTAEKSGVKYDKVILSPMSHAGYYPGGKVMTVKVLFEKESFRLLGAQIVGYDGVDKRIDVFATAARAGLDARELKDIDLAYAPPYSSAKDPVNMAGFMIDNVANGTLKQWFVEDEKNLPRDGSVTLLDTRTPGEYKRGHVKDFINIPVDELRGRLDEIEKDKPVYVICQSGLRSYIASRILEGNGYTAYNFAGGFRFYDAVMNDKALIEKEFPCGMDR
ncbi:MAG: FAD-dependent oxidoreductase [Oscillospiraceae bacterium]|nr:FAD-dependent oxidoreductase [Oscillospiraceae bacterium]